MSGPILTDDEQQPAPVTPMGPVPPTPDTVPHRAGIAGLWHRSDNIHNPLLRVMAKVGTGILGVADRAGAVVAPGVEAAIPGSTVNRAIQVRNQQKQETVDAANKEKESQAEEASARANAIRNPQPKEGLTPEETTIHDLMTGENGQPRMNPETQKPYNYLEAFQAVKQAGQDVKPDKTANEGKTVTTDKGVMQWNPDSKRYDIPVGGSPKQEKPDTPEQQYQDAIQSGDHEAAARILKVMGDIAKAKQAPERPQRALMTVPQGDGSQKVIEATPGMTIPGTAEKPGAAASASRKDVATHDKAYVQPAETVEKSYQMMDSAYREYEAARKEGKDLPTGAQSMLALSTHLSTTFGNVKGARVTKDMIHEHLGARGISDSALVAIQRLTNGDQLSPDQWTAFHNLISESRKLSWQTAVKEANRKQIPVDFLPPDLQNLTSGKSGNAPPAGAKVRDYSELGK